MSNANNRAFDAVEQSTIVQVNGIYAHLTKRSDGGFQFHLPSDIPAEAPSLVTYTKEQLGQFLTLGREQHSNLFLSTDNRKIFFFKDPPPWTGRKRSE